MILTDKFAFVHIAKTGGVFFRQVIMMSEYCQIISSAQQTESLHAPLWEMSVGNLPVVVTQRIPSDWYVSWYHFIRKIHSEGSERHHVFDAATENDTLPIDIALRRVSMPDESMLSALEKAGYEELVKDWRTLGLCDWYTFRKMAMMARNYPDVVNVGAIPDLSNIHVLRTEHMIDDYLKFLTTIGVEYRRPVEMIDTLEYRLRTIPPVNTALPGVKESCPVEDGLLNAINIISAEHSTRLGL